MSRRHRAPRPPRAHWLLLSALLLTVCALLSLNVLTSGQVGGSESPPSESADHVPEAARSAGAVVDPREPAVHRLPDRAVALTFVDGPDPLWTRPVLAALARHQVRATFFLSGAQAARYPELVGDIVAAGHEIGNRTATRADLRAASPLRIQFELQATDLVLAGAQGLTTNLVQPPYVAKPGALDDEAWDAALRIGNSGRQIVLADLDSEDWRQPGADAIVANSTPKDQRGAVLLMHDSGGTQTVAALDRLLPSMKDQGRRIDTVTGALNVSGATNQAAPLDRISGQLLIGAVQLATWLADSLRVLFMIALVLAALRTLLVLVIAPLHVLRSPRRRASWAISQRVAVIVPAYNEEAGIAATVRSILASDHPVEVLVVDDGSIDRTADVVRDLQRRLPRVRLIQQENAGKAVALNAGLAAARSELVVMVDGDTVLDRSAVGRLVRHFTDPAIGAVSGNAKVGNRRGLLGCWQHIEYVIGFNLDRRMYDMLRCMPTVPGAIGAFRRSAVARAGGVSLDTLAEDTDLTMALERDGWRVIYEERARAWTEAPATLGQLWKQRYRWCYGTLQAVWKHRGAVLERGAGGRLGRRGLPYLVLFQVLLQVLAPVVDIAALFGMFTDEPSTVLATWAGFLALQAVPGMIAFRLDRERLRPLLALPLQQIVYRQLMYLVVVQSVATALAGARLPWHKLERQAIRGVRRRHAVDRTPAPRRPTRDRVRR